MQSENQIIAIILPIYKPDAYIDNIYRNEYSKWGKAIKIIIESESNVHMPADHGDAVYRLIKQREFNHGGTRNLGAKLATERGATIIVFMTQDAIPDDDTWLSKLIAPIERGEAAATFGRQIPQSNAGLLERFSRYFNYPTHSQSRTIEDIERMGVKAFFFSNVCSAVRSDIFWEIGGFSEDVIMNEDMLLAAQLLRNGHVIKYVAEAEVVHSHNYTLKQQFARNFDVGAFFSDAGSMLMGAKVIGEGLRFVGGQIKYISMHKRLDLFPLVIAEAAVKLIGFQLGKYNKILPLDFKKRFSMHSYHWDQKEEAV